MRVFGYEVKRAMAPLRVVAPEAELARYSTPDARVLRAVIAALLLLYQGAHDDRWSRRYMQNLGMTQGDWQAGRILLRAADLMGGDYLWSVDPLQGVASIARIAVAWMREVRRNPRFTLPV